MTARYFDLVDFQNYDFLSSTWTTRFKGQLKRGDQFLSIYHRPTRKRMLYTDGTNNPSSSVVRVVTTGEIFMVGAIQPDVHDNVHYRNIYAMTKPQGIAYVYRKAPTGPANNPGWAVKTLVETTWADVEIRTVNENEELSLIHDGHVILTLPIDTVAQPLDLILIDGLDTQYYRVLERYVDSNLINLRATSQEDELVDFVLKHHTGQSYANQQVIQTYTNYNVTGRVAAVAEEEMLPGYTESVIKIFIKGGWVGVTPSLKDKVVFRGQEYDVRKVVRDPLTLEWHVIADL